MRRFSTDGCEFDRSLLGIKLAASIAALFVFALVSDRAVAVAGEAVLDAALPLLDSPAGMQTCLAWSTPNFLNNGAVLFRALMLAFVLSSVVSLTFCANGEAKHPPVEASKKRQ
jgi:hypothetical protein